MKRQIVIKRIQTFLKYSPIIFKQLLGLWETIKEIINEETIEKLDELVEMEELKNVNNNHEK